MPAMNGTLDACGFSTGTGTPTGTPNTTPSVYFDTSTSAWWVWPSGGSAWAQMSGGSSGPVRHNVQASAPVTASIGPSVASNTSPVTTLVVTNPGTVARPIRLLARLGINVTPNSTAIGSVLIDTEIALNVSDGFGFISRSVGWRRHIIAYNPAHVTGFNPTVGESFEVDLTDRLFSLGFGAVSGVTSIPAGGTSPTFQATASIFAQGVNRPQGGNIQLTLQAISYHR